MAQYSHSIKEIIMNYRSDNKKDLENELRREFPRLHTKVKNAFPKHLMYYGIYVPCKDLYYMLDPDDIYAHNKSFDVDARTQFIVQFNESYLCVTNESTLNVHYAQRYKQESLILDNHHMFIKRIQDILINE